MTIVPFEKIAGRVASSAAPKLRTFGTQVLKVVDALAEARMQRAQEEIRRVPAAWRTVASPRTDSSPVGR